jgi:hypothetical protein
MRVVVRIPAVEDRLAADQDAVTLALLELERSAILGLSGRECQQVVKSVRRNVDLGQVARKRVIELLSRCPLVQNGPLEEDFAPDDEPFEGVRSVVSLVLDPKFRSKVNELRTCPSVGEDRSKAFARSLERHARASVRVTIFDRYFGSDLVTSGDHSGAAWLLEQLANVGLRRVEVITASMADRPGDVEEVVRSHGVRLDLDLSFLVTRFGHLMHDRHIRFGFGSSRGSEAISLGRGAASFNSVVLDQNFQALLMNEQDAIRFEQQIRTAEARTP